MGTGVLAAMVHVAILGAGGRMGQTLVRCAQPFDALKITAAIEQDGHPALGQDAGLLAGIGASGLTVTTPSAAARADVVIDFTFHAAVPGNLARAVQAGQAYVLGTTGLTEDEKAAVTAASRQIPIVWSPNMSLGVNLLLELVRRAASVLDAAYDVEIIELHHRHKRDAPSGTALGLAEAVAQGRGVKLDDVVCCGREGVGPERPRNEIGLHAVRGGDIVGDHTVLFAADGERVEFVHRAASREAFARGALRAAHWVHGRAPGVYPMRDVLGLT